MLGAHTSLELNGGVGLRFPGSEARGVGGARGHSGERTPVGWVTCLLRCGLSHEKSQEHPPEAVGSGLRGPCASPVRVAVGELASQWGHPSQEGCHAGLGGPGLAVLLLSL